jgi:RNA polymerase sigma-70 factor (ECF subfamily)
MQLTRNHDDACDLVQNSVVRAFSKLHQYDRSKPFVSWFMTILRNQAHDIYRQRGRRIIYSLDDFVEDSNVTYADAIADERPSPEQIALNGALGEVLHRALEQVPYHQREAVRVIDLQDASYLEAAAILGVNMGTAKSRRHRGIGALREVLGHV